MGLQLNEIPGAPQSIKSITPILGENPLWGEVRGDPTTQADSSGSLTSGDATTYRGTGAASDAVVSASPPTRSSRRLTLFNETWEIVARTHGCWQRVRRGLVSSPRSFHQHQHSARSRQYRGTRSNDTPRRASYLASQSAPARSSHQTPDFLPSVRPES